MRPRSLTSWPFLRAQSRMAPACSRSVRPPPPVARERPAPEARVPRLLTLRAAETYLPSTSRISLAFFSDRSISYVVPSRAKVTVSSAEMLSSRSSLRMTWTLRAIVYSLLLPWACGPSTLLPRVSTSTLHHNRKQFSEFRCTGPEKETRAGDLLVQWTHQREQDRLSDA